MLYKVGQWISFVHADKNVTERKRLRSEAHTNGVTAYGNLFAGSKMISHIFFFFKLLHLWMSFW